MQGIKQTAKKRGKGVMQIDLLCSWLEQVNSIHAHRAILDIRYQQGRSVHPRRGRESEK